jgi:hypothetical protein
MRTRKQNLDRRAIMNHVGKVFVAILIGLSVAAFSSSASAQNMSKRDAAITQCIQEAHAQYP